MAGRSRSAHVEDHLLLATEGARATIDVRAGGRLASLVIDDREILVTQGDGPLAWGSFPMAPFAGRLRHGTFRFRGRSWRVPVNAPPHAIHGFVAERPWRQDDEQTISVELGSSWPFAGRVMQHFHLSPGQLAFRMSLEAVEPMPASIGWHPWLLRRPGWVGQRLPGAIEPAPLELEFAAGSMYLRDSEGIATSRLVAPTPRPWDDCFTDLRHPPVLRWGRYLELTIESTCTDWVVYDEPAHTLCVEPQTAPPDGPNIRPQVVVPGRPLVAEMRWRWRSLA
jgi:aldose 1-epimerase